MYLLCTVVHTFCFSSSLSLLTHTSSDRIYTTCILSSLPLFPVTSLIDAYSPTSVLSSHATVPLGTTVVLVCRVGGVASGTQLSYTWTCPNGPCDVGEGNNPNRKTYGDRMVLNVLTSRDGGMYTCLVREGQDAVHGSSFTLNVQGGWYIQMCRVLGTVR